MYALLLISALVIVGAQQSDLCYNVKLVDAPAPVCAGTTAVALTAYRHPSTGLYYLYPSKRSRSVANGPTVRFNCSGSLVAPLLPTDPNYKVSLDQVNDNCPCNLVGTGQPQYLGYNANAPWSNGSSICNGDPGYCSALEAAGIHFPNCGSFGSATFTSTSTSTSVASTTAAPSTTTGPTTTTSTSTTHTTTGVVTTTPSTTCAPGTTCSDSPTLCNGTSATSGVQGDVLCGARAFGVGGNYGTVECNCGSWVVVGAYCYASYCPVTTTTATTTHASTTTPSTTSTTAQGTTATPTNTGCTCTSSPSYTVIQEYNLGGAWVVPDVVTIYSSFLTVSDLPVRETADGAPWGVHESSQKRRRNFAVRAALTSISLDGQTVVVNTPYPFSTLVQCVKDGISNLFQCAETMCLNTLQDAYFLNPGDVMVKTFINDTLDNSASLPVTSFIRCPIPRCLLCSDMYVNFSCFPWEFQAFVVSMTIVACLGALFLIIVIIRGTVRIQCCKKGCNKIKDKIVRLRARSQPSAPSSDEDQDAVPVDELPDRPAAKQKKARLILLLVLLALPLTLAEPCASGVTIPVSSTVCEASGSQETCSLTFSTTFTVPGPGQAACFTFAKTDGSVVTTLNVTYESMQMKAPLQDLYWTGNWAPASYSVKECPGTYLCGSCSNFDPVADPLACGGTPPGSGPQCLIPETLAPWKGRTDCSAECGCAGCQCFFCDGSCVYSRAVIEPQAPFCLVQQAIAVYNQPQLRVDWSSQGSTATEGVSVVAQQVQVGNNFTLTMVGTLQGDASFINNERVIQCTDSFYGIGFAAAPQQPIPGAVGDIQAGSLSDFGPGGAYIFAPSMITPQYASSTTNYIFSPVGLLAKAAFNNFPTPRGTVIWSLNGYYLYGLDQSPGAVVATISTNEPLVVTRTVAVVCPAVSLPNITGCYSCGPGATIQFFGFSRCSAGSASVFVSGDCITGTTSVVLQTSATLISMQVNSGVPNPTCSVTLSSSGYSASFSVSGVLVAEDLITVSNSTFSHSNSTTSSPFPGISGFFLNLPDWQGALVLVAIIIASIAGLVVVLCVVKCFWDRRQQRIMYAPLQK